MAGALALVAVLAATVAAAPGLSVRLGSRPASLVAGTPWAATLVVSRGGRPVTGARPVLVATAGPMTRSFRATAARTPGRYLTRAVFPVAGRWALTARVGATRVRLGIVDVVARPAPPTVREPFSIAAAPDGTVVVANGRDHRVLRVDPRTRTVSVVAGNARELFSGDGGPATAAGVAFPIAVAVDRGGNVYIASSARIRRVDAATKAISTVAGTGQDGFSGDGGPAASARLQGTTGLAVDAAGNLYIAEYAGRIRRVDAATGTIETIAGTAHEAYGGDGGPAATAQINRPHGVAVGPDGAIYIGDTYNARIRRIDRTTGVITTFAGSGAEGYGGDGGPAGAALLHSPTQLAVGNDGSVIFADHGNNAVRHVDPRGRVSTLARLTGAAAVTFDAAGTVFAGGLDPGVLVRIDPASGAVARLAD